MVLLIITYLLTAISIFGAFIPLWPSHHWLVKSQVYFRAVYALSSLISFIMVFLLDDSWIKILLLLLLATSFLICLMTIIAFMPFAKKELKDSESRNKECLDILVFNVYQYNSRYSELLELIAQNNPAIVLLVETDHKWESALEKIKTDYPYVIKEIRENTYGILLFSKRPFELGQINHLVKEDVPSVHLKLTMQNEKLNIFGIHPRPPVPGEAEYSFQKDAELLKVAHLIEELPEEEHSIVLGDLNDVAWSNASRAFKKRTLLKDPRVGRGFYSTFPTWFPIRFPLDHVYCSEKFQLRDFRILENIGSDHFPVFISLCLGND